MIFFTVQVIKSTTKFDKKVQKVARKLRFLGLWLEFRNFENFRTIAKNAGNGSKIAFKKIRFSPKLAEMHFWDYDVMWWRHRAKIIFFHETTIHKPSFEPKVNFFEKNFFLKGPKIWGSKIFYARIWGHFEVKMPKCKFMILFYDFCDFFQVSSISGSKIPKIEAPLVAKRGIRQSQPLGGRVALN